MTSNIEKTLNLLETWYEESRASDERTLLLSKLALLELCGWLEGALDDLIREVGTLSINDAGWINKHIIKRTNGFDYSQHFAPMLRTLLGEATVRSVEARLEASSPGDLARMQRLLSELWTTRCDHAHVDITFTVAQQKSVDAPSTSRAVQKDLEGLLAWFRLQLLDATGRVVVAHKC